MTFKDIKNNPDKRRKFLRDYSLLSGVEVCATCTSKLQGYFEHYQKLLTMNSNRKYELIPGSLVWVKAFNNYVTNDNLTDEMAEKMLATSRAYAKFFSRMPSEVTEKPKAEETAEKALTYEEILLSVDGIGKGYVKKIKALHTDKASLLAAIAEGNPTGIDASFNEGIVAAFSN